MRVSVLMSVFNGMPYLRRAVDSVLGQTLTDLKFVIINDGSTDNTGDYLESLDDPRVEVMHQENAGLPAALTKGLEACGGELLARMDSDDICEPDRLARQVEFMAEHPDVVALGCYLRLLGPDGRVGRVRRMPVRHRDVLAVLLDCGLGIFHPSVCMRADAVRRVGGYRDMPAEDMDLFLRLSTVGRLANLPTPLLKARMHFESATATNMRGHQLGFRYHVDSYQRRNRGEDPLRFEEFVTRFEQRPLLKRLAWAVDQYALRQYKRSTCEVLGDAPLTGRLRLGWAALCAPQRTVKRLCRGVLQRFSAPSGQGEARGEHWD